MGGIGRTVKDGRCPWDRVQTHVALARLLSFMGSIASPEWKNRYNSLYRTMAVCFYFSISIEKSEELRYNIRMLVIDFT